MFLTRPLALLDLQHLDELVRRVAPAALGSPLGPAAPRVEELVLGVVLPELGPDGAPAPNLDVAAGAEVPGLEGQQQPDLGGVEALGLVDQVLVFNVLRVDLRETEGKGDF